MLAILAPAAQALVEVPPLQSRVTDLTGTLTAPQRGQLEEALAAIEREHGAQVAVLMVPSTRPEAIEQFSIRVAEAWRLGRGREAARRDTGRREAHAIDDGVLLLVAKDDRRVRIEVGYGLEGAIPDAIAQRIIAESITPRLRAGDFHGGLQAAIADLGRRIAGESLPAPRLPGTSGADPMALLPLVVMSFFLGVFLSNWIGRLSAAALGGGGAALAAGGALASIGLGAAVGALVFLAVLLFGGRGGGGGRLRRMGRRTIGDGPVFVPGGGWRGGGGFGGGGFRGGGGFGGRGGGFGGGGASGGW